jgi:hypothetical protein
MIAGDTGNVTTDPHEVVTRLLSPATGFRINTRHTCLELEGRLSFRKRAATEEAVARMRFVVTGVGDQRRMFMDSRRHTTVIGRPAHRPQALVWLVLVAFVWATLPSVHGQEPVPPSKGLPRNTLEGLAPPSPVPFAQKPQPSSEPRLVPPVSPGKTNEVTIDANTPLKDLLPIPPQSKKRPAILVEDPTQVLELDFQQPLAKTVPVVEANKHTASLITRINHLNGKKPEGFLEALISQRADLKGLPYAMGDACRMKGERSQQFALALAMVRRSMQRFDPKGDMPLGGQMDAGGATAFWKQFQDSFAKEDWTEPGLDRERQENVTLARIAALMQVLAVEGPQMRLGLVRYLTRIPHAEATRALARLAIFTEEDEVRQAALEALKVRRERDYTEVLLQGLRYPLPAIARRAGEAVLKLERNDLVPQLVDLLDEPDPRAPVVKVVGEKRVPEVREVVRVNHHKNCLLCHAPADTKAGDKMQLLLSAPVPTPSEPLPSPSQGYRSRKSSNDILVRIDVTYLRQDFSLLQPVADANPWPEMQRFDFLVRTRELTDDEAAEFRAKLAKQGPDQPSPYQRTLLAALRGLTGRDTEPTPAAWRRLLELPAKRPTAAVN